MTKKLLLILTTAFLSLNFLSAQTLNKSFVTTNGAVRAIVQQGDTVYIGGDFTQVGMQSRGIARFNPGNTKPDINFPQLGANNTVNAIENDGNGGFYIAGNFINFNGTLITNHSKILHILNNGSIDASFGAVIADGNILCMKFSGGELYIGGAFINIQNTNRPYLAELNATSGALENWIPATPDNAVEKIDASSTKVFVLGSAITNFGGFSAPTHFAALRLSDGVYQNNFPTANNNITAFAVSSNTLYIGGNFNQVGPRAVGLAKLSAADASVDQNFPSTNGNVMSVLPDGNGGYYVGGSFTKVANKNRTNLAHILNDGTVDGSFTANTNDQVLCIAADATNLYVGGYFTTVNGTSRNYVAAVLKTTGALTSWNPNPDNYVLTIALANNNIYLGGWFNNINTTPRNYAAAITTAGTLTNWDPGPDYYVNQIISNNTGTSFFICGGFLNVKGSAHEYIVKVNKTNGNPVSWRPHPDDVVKSIALSGSTMYMAGSFHSVNGKAREFLAAVDTSSNQPTSFQADLNNFPNYINIAAGKLYVVGNYSEIQNQNISYISRIDLSTGIVDGDWQPVSNGYTAVVYSNGTDVIAGGNFTLMNGLQKNFMAAVNLGTNKFTSWSANGVASFNINSIQKILPVGSDIFVGGDFNYFDGFNTVYNVLAIDNSLGNISHTLLQYPLGAVSQLSIYDNQLMVGGNFVNFYDLNASSTVSRKNIAGYDQSNYTLSSLIYNANDTLNGMFTDAAGNLIISGNFSLLNYVNRNYLAAIGLNSTQALSFNPSPDDAVNALAVNGSSLFVGGKFKNIAGQQKDRVASININTGNANTWFADCDSDVNAMAAQNNILYIGGLFTQVKGSARLHAAAISTTGSGALKSWLPNPDNSVNAIATSSDIYLGGEFNNIKTTTRNYLAKVSASSGGALGWNPNPNNTILSFALNDTTIFVGGNQFTKISNKTRNALAAYTISNNALTSFNPNLQFNNNAPQINALALNGNTLYIGTTALDLLNGVSRGRLAAADITTSNAVDFNPLPDSTVLSLTVGDNYLFAGGLWNNLGNNVSPSYFAVFSLDAQPKSLPKNLIADNTSTKNISADNDVTVYPNPAINTVTIDFKKETTSTISFMNADGKTLWIKNNFARKQLQFSVQNLANGTYFIIIKTGAKADKLKLVKE
jgi:hypothetical protein